MRRTTGLIALTGLLLMLSATMAFAQPLPQSATYDEAQNLFTITFTGPVYTTDAEFIVANIIVDDDNGGPFDDLVLRGGQVLNSTETSSTVRFTPIFGTVLSEYTYDDEGSDVIREVWGNDYSDVITLEDEMLHGNMRLYVPAGAAMSTGGALSQHGWVPLSYTDQANLPALDQAHYDAATNILSLTFTKVMQYDQLPEDIALDSPQGDWKVAGNGILDNGIDEDRNGNETLDMEQNVVVAAITMSDANGGSYTLVSGLDMTRQDAATLDLELSPPDRAAVEELDASSLMISFGDYTFVDVDYNPAVPVDGFPVAFTADSDPLIVLSASYDMGTNTLEVNFDEPLDSAVRDHAVIPKLILHHSVDTELSYALEAGEPGLANDDSTLVVTPGVGTAQAIETHLDAENMEGFMLYVRRDAVRSAEGNGNLLGEIDLEVIPEDSRNKAPELDPDGVLSYDAITNELRLPFDVRLDDEVEIGGILFHDGSNDYALTDATIDRADGNRTLVLTLSPADQHMVENVLDSGSMSLTVEPYSIKQQRILNGNRLITVDPLTYVADENPPLVNYFFYDEQNDRYVVGANVTIHPDDVNLAASTVNGISLSAGSSLEQAEPTRVFIYSDSPELEELPLADRTELILDIDEGFIRNGDGIANLAVMGLADGDTTENDIGEAVLTLGYGREFWIRSHEAFPTVPRSVAASLRRVSDGALWYVANDQWAPYDPFAVREGKDKPHPVVTALRPSELDSAVAFFEDSTPKVPDMGAREVVLDVMAGDRASAVPQRVNILLADIYDEFGLGRNDSKAGFWRHGYFLPTDLPGKGEDEFANDAELIVIDSYPQSFNEGDVAYTWSTSDEDWNETDMADMDRAGLPALANVYTQYVAYKVDQFEQRWVRDGLAFLAQFLTYENPEFYGDGTAGGLKGNNSLLFIGSDFKARTDFKHVYMYFLYLWEKYGGNDFIRTLATSPRTSMSGVSDALTRRHDSLAPWQQDHDVLDVYLDFATANLIDTSYADDNNRFMFDNLDTQGAVPGTSLKWKPTAGKDRPPYELSTDDWGFNYYFTGYGDFDPNPLLDPTVDDLIINVEEGAEHIGFRKMNFVASSAAPVMSDLPIYTQDIEFAEGESRAAVPMSPDGASGEWVFGAVGSPDHPNATFPTWVLVAAGGGDFLLHHDANPAEFARLFVSQNKVITNTVDLYIISALPFYRSDGVSTPTVILTSDEAGEDVLAVYDSPDDYILTEVENSSGRFLQYVAHLKVIQTGTLYWHLGGQYSNGVPVDGGDPGMVVMSTFRGGEAGTLVLKDGTRITAGRHTFEQDRDLIITRNPLGSEIAGGMETASDGRHSPVSDQYGIGRAGERLRDPMVISLPFDRDRADAEELGLYLRRDGRWDYVGGMVDEHSGMITARVGQLGTYQVMAGPTGDVPADLAIPTAFELGPNYPNPFNPSTRFQVSLPHTGDVRLVVYDLLGREVARVHDGTLPFGTHTFTFDASGQASGVYFLRMEAAGFNDARKLVLVK